MRSKAALNKAAYYRGLVMSSGRDTSERKKFAQKVTYTYSQLICECVSQDTILATKILESTGNDPPFVSIKINVMDISYIDDCVPYKLLFYIFLIVEFISRNK